MRLSVKGLALAGGVTWAIGVLAGGVVAFAAPDWGGRYMELLGAIYPGVEGVTFRSLLVATGYSLVDGAVGGALLAWLYNRFAGAGTPAREGQTA